MSTKDRKQREKEERYQQIIDAAEMVMTKHGLAGLNMDLIAQETHLAKGTLYLYFKSKDDLLGELSLKARRLLLTEFREAVARHTGAIDQLKALVKANYTFHRRNPLYYELVSLHEINNRLAESPELQQASAEITLFTVAIAEQARQEGALNPAISPVSFAICLWGMTVGMMQLIKVRGAAIQQQTSLGDDDLLQTFVDLIENGIRN